MNISLAKKFNNAFKNLFQKMNYNNEINIKGLLIFVVMLLAVYTKPHAQTGSVEGRVTDINSGEPLVGATIVLENTTMGTAADRDGRFRLDRLPAGEQILEVSFIGYLSKKINVNIIENEVVSVEIGLQPGTVEGEEVVVTSQAMGQASAIQRQLSSNTIVNVLSEVRIKDVPDANAAEAVGRMPGVSIVRDGGEARRVSIRGLASRFNNTLINGVKIPSTDLEGRAVDLNMISQEMLSGIEVFKTVRPDMDADAIGGTVNFGLASAASDPRFRLNGKGGYSGQVNEFSNWGISTSGSKRFLDDLLGVTASFDFERNDRSNDVLVGGFLVERDPREGEEFAPLLIQNLSLRDTEETRDRIGGGLLFDLNIPNGKIFFGNNGGRLNRDVYQLDRRFNLGSTRQEWNLRTQDIQVDVLTSSLSGEQLFPNLNSIKIEWQVSRNISTREIPFDHDVEFNENAGFTEGVDQLESLTDIEPLAKNDFRETFLQRSDFRTVNTRERDWTGSIDISIPYFVSDFISGEIQFGGKRIDKTRKRRDDLRSLFIPISEIADFEDREFIFTSIGRLSMLNYINRDFSRSNFLDDFTIPVGLDRELVNSIWELHNERFLENLEGNFNSQDGSEKITAGYVMSEVNVGDKLMILPGFRYEYTDQEFTGNRGTFAGTVGDQGSFSDTTAAQNFDQWFPMIQTRFRLTNWFDIRGAWTQSSSRPTFTELMPRLARNPQSRRITAGNSSLRPSEASNYDLFFTVHSNKIGLFAVGGFYKKIDDLIFFRDSIVLQDYEELGLNSGDRGSRFIRPVNNPNQTEVKGIEVEWQSNLTFLPSPFNGIVINANFTHISSETQFPQSEVTRTAEGIVRIDTFRVGPMPFQPDNIANVSVGYDYKGFSARVSFLHQGSTLTSVGARRELDSFTEGIYRWDATLKQKIISGIEAFANIRNITDEPDASNQFTGEFPTRREFFGRAFDFGVRLRFQDLKSF